ncbi:MAG TPA: hypothetical protein VLF91_03685 [Candidatus Saccharimonadales bacterium]|nr:hypothetical protein [Candidatus Saccharimonadales bacterium]
MFFVSTDHAKRNLAFERSVDFTLDAIANGPEDMCLGEDLRSLAENAFLPNIDASGRATVPPSLLGQTGRVALLPLAAAEMYDDSVDIAPILTHFEPVQPFQAVGYSPVHGRLLEPEDGYILLGHLNTGIGDITRMPHVSARLDGRPLKAVTSMQLDLDGNRFRRATPAICFDARYLTNYSPEENGAVMLHEFTHLADSRRVGPLHDTSHGAAATEFRAYEVTRRALSGVTSTLLASVEDVEAIRVAHSVPGNPYVATDTGVLAMRAAGYIDR